MIIRVTNNQGFTAIVDNEGEENGSVKIQGDSPLVSHLDRLLNSALDIPFRGQRSEIDKRFKTRRDEIEILYKASDIYLKEHFIAVECTMFGYTVEVIKE